MEKHPISAVLEHYGSQHLECENRWIKLKCPFHGDSHASAAVNTELNTFKCFACGIQGDTYAVIMQHEGVDFLEAYRRAEEFTGISRQQIRRTRRSSGGISKGSRDHIERRAYTPPGGSGGTISRE